MSIDPESPHSQALRYISNSRFHRLFKHDDLKISYADIGAASDTTILFMPGMFASRYLAVWMHTIAESLGVRMLVVDRPGMGASNPVPLEKRVPVWIDLVPKLLAHLNIPYVALASHSAGMIYLLNTMYHCRDLLHPERPYVAFLAPWVNPTHSTIKTMQLAQYLPTPIFSIWNRVPQFLLLTATPALASSGLMLNKISAASGSTIQSSTEGECNAEELNRQRMAAYGLSKELQKELEPLVWRFMFEEGTKGANEEAMQCLGKGPRGSWGVCEDYEAFMGEVVEKERERRLNGDQQGHGRLVVRGFFAESDNMVGEKGRMYLERCWKGQGSNSTGNSGGGFGDVLDFETAVIPHTDHNTIGLETRLLKRLFLEATGRWSGGGQN